MKPPLTQFPPRFSSITLLIVVLIALAACGPVAIGVAVGSGGGGGGTSEPLTLTSERQPPSTQSGSCGLIVELQLMVNRPNATLTYSLNGGAPTPFSDPRTGLSEPELVANTRQLRSVLVRAGDNTVQVRASVGSEQVQETLSFTIDVDPVAIDLESPDVRGQDMLLNWSMATGEAPFFWIYFDDQAASSIDGLSGTAGNGTSPLRVPVSQLASVVNGNRTRYSVAISNLARSAEDLAQHHYFAVRAYDGCESRIVCAHTRPEPQRLQWPIAARTSLNLTTPSNENAAPPVGGSASSVNVVGMPVLLVDRGADDSDLAALGAADGLEDMVFADRVGTVFVSRNDFGTLTAPIAVDDAEFTMPSCPSVPTGPTGELIRSFAVDYDADQRPDLFLLTAQRLWVFAADDNAPEAASSRPTLGAANLLNFKKYCSAFLDLASLPNLTAGEQFLDAWYGDFDGNGTLDLVASVGRPQTSSQAGETNRLFVWYSDHDGNGYGQWDWPAHAPQQFAVGSTFGDDAYFLVADIDQDGRDDLVTMVHSNAATARYRVLLMRGRTAPPSLLESGDVDPTKETARWDQTTVADVDQDGVLDLIGLRSYFNGAGTIVQVLGYRTMLAANAIDTVAPLFQHDLVRTHSSVPNGAPRQRGHLQIRDVDGDGLADILVRSIASGSEYTTSRITVYRGQIDPISGHQNWQTLDTTPRLVDFSLANGETPHVHFAAADLNYDGVEDFCAIHEQSSPPHHAIVMHSSPLWAYERFPGPVMTSNFPLAGTLPTGGGASVAQTGKVDRAGDLILGVDATQGVAVLPSLTDAGVPNGAFQPVRHVAVEPPLPAPVQQFQIPLTATTNGDLLVLCTNGNLGTLEYDAGVGNYHFRNEANLPDAAIMRAAKFDSDARADCVIVDAASRLHLMATVDASGAPNQDLAERDSRQLPRATEMVLVTNIGGDELSEVAVVLAPLTGSEIREVQVWSVLRDNATGRAQFVDPPKMTSFPTRLTSLVASNLTGRFRNNEEKRKWLIGGTADGRILAVRGGGAFDPAQPIATIGPLGTGEIVVLATDLTGDHIPDLVAYEKGSMRLSILRNRPDTVEPWRFPNQNGYQFQGLGEFDSPVVVPLPEPLQGLTSSRVDNDPYADLVALSADGQRVHLLVTKAAQRKL